MKVICASCGKYLGDKPSNNFGANAVSHGLCKPCAHHFIAQVGMTLTEYMEGIPAPVVTVTPDGSIGTTNQEACELLGKSLDQIHGFKGGDVFECEYAQLPGGCGKTIHCSGCTIRNTVMDTMETGKSHIRAPAYLNPESDIEEHRMDLLISTKKEGGVVFLTIEEMKQSAPKK